MLHNLVQTLGDLNGLGQPFPVVAYRAKVKLHGTEQLKAIRRGEWPLERLIEWAQDKEKALEAVYHTSTLRYGPDEPVIKRHLLHCLEAHYGDLSAAVVIPGAAERLIAQISELVRDYRGPC